MLGAAVASAVSLNAQELKQGNNAEARPRTPSEQLKSFTVPAGFQMELVASEETGLPKPISIAFDDAGRLWSMTATEYPRDNEPGFWTTPGTDRVVVFDDPLKPGPHTARVFADGMHMPASVLPYRRGVVVAQGPEILFLDDADGDGRADRREVWLKGFGVQDTHTLPHQLEFAPGHWITFSQGVLNNGTAETRTGQKVNFDKTVIARFRPGGTDLQVIGAGLNNIWSWVLDRQGQVFFHEANDFGYAVVPFEPDTTYPSFIKRLVHPNSPLHPPTTPDLKLGGTGFSGLALSDDREGSFPAPWKNVFFIANPITRRINTVAMVAGPNGVPRFTQLPDLVATDDDFFRPVALRFGPDGCLYIVDWYNRIISHNEVDRNHPGRDKSRGRIWRVRHQNQGRQPVPNVAAAPTTELLRHLQAPGTWESRAAWHQIRERGARELVPGLTSLALSPQTPDDTRILALWCLEDLGVYDPTVWKAFLTHSNPALRREAVRALSTVRPPISEAFTQLQVLADESHRSVRYAVLRYFRDIPEPVTAEQRAWLGRWQTPPTSERTVTGWEGPFFALGGPYENAFQNLLLQMVDEKGQNRSVAAPDPRWSQVVATHPARSAADQTALHERIQRLVPLIDGATGVDLKKGQLRFMALCSGCHSVNTDGKGWAPSLSGSQNRSTEAILTSILDPHQAIESIFRLYRAETQDGRRWEGFLSELNAESLTLRFQGGTQQVIPVSTLRSAGYIEGRSAMPEGLAAGLDGAQLTELVRYVQSVK